MKKTITLLSFIIMGSLSAQTFIGKISPVSTQVNNLHTEGTLKILAVMVEFQEDRFSATSGNGKFGTIFSGENLTRTDIIDPLPHDKDYFADHLTFTANYFSSVSKGNLEVTFEILPDIITLSEPMRGYSPEVKSSDLSLVGKLAEETWSLADQNNPGLDFSQYDMFVIFHAGVGRDISVPGSIGIERDIPSVYMNESSLKKFLGNDFDGFSVNNGNFKIKNSAILPETESRELSSINGKVLLQLSINGLIAAMVGSHLGLPDLYNTETGQSAIGRFGLMDGQSIFVYSGLFLPEPSPWEKMYLGWETPTVIPISDLDVSLVNRLVANSTDTTLIKIPINSSEYFLIENRLRDARDDGAMVTHRMNGEVKITPFEKDTTGFYSWGVDSVAGVVLSVDEYDWALPGSGIVIWHIDESVIDANMESNTINNDKFRKGVAVVEADGIPDIGEQFQTIFGDIVIGEGSEEDFWHLNNKAELYSNKFTPETKPNTNSNSGASSLLSILNFSAIGNEMSFQIRNGNEDAKLIISEEYSFIDSVAFMTTIQSGQTGNLFFNDGKKIIRYNLSSETSSVIGKFNTTKPIISYNNVVEVLVGLSSDRTMLKYYLFDGVTEVIDSTFVNDIITSNLVIADELNDYFTFYFGTNSGKVNRVEFSYTMDATPQIVELPTVSATEKIKNIVSDNSGSNQFFFTNDKLIDDSGNEYSFGDSLEQVVYTIDAAGNSRIVALQKDNNFEIVSVVNSDFSSEYFSFESGARIESFIITDNFSDGENYILFTLSGELFALNQKGYLADNYPLEDPLGVGFIGTPLSINIADSNENEVLISTKDGRIFLVSGSKLKDVNNFPLSSGSRLSTTPILFNYEEKPALAVIDESNIFSVWQISSKVNDYLWSGEMGGARNNSFVEQARTTNRSVEFFPNDRAYNWPNPVYENETYIRYYVSEDADVSIKIFDLSGDMVAELNDRAIGGFDNETTWDVSNMQSGVYFAQLEVSGNGKTSSKIIKIAIIK